MKLDRIVNGLQFSSRLDILARQIVEGYMSGMHKSPFHGFSSEFAEHKMYNPGESTRHIDWKLYARTSKLYTRRYEEETNLRCHLILDHSPSMYYPEIKSLSPEHLNKIGFATLACAALIHIFKRQRDAVGLSMYADRYTYYAPEKGNERHFNTLVHALEQQLMEGSKQSGTDTVRFLHQIAEKIHRRSMIFVFTDMFQAQADPERLFSALRHLKYNKHEVVLVHVTHKRTEVEFDFGSVPSRFVDVETGESLSAFPVNLQQGYREQMEQYLKGLRTACARYQISYVQADVEEGVEKILTAYLIERKRFR